MLTTKHSQFVLWLTTWFPSKNSPLNGDFILRHAVATSAFIPIVLIYIEKDPKIDRIKKDVVVSGRCTFIRVYYPIHSRIKSVEKIFSILIYFWISFCEYRKIVSEKGRPKSIHVHVAQKSLLIGWILSKLDKIPLLLSEHSSRFLHESEDSFFKLPLLNRVMFRFLLNQTKMITAVSNHLATSIATFAKTKRVVILPNVVNEHIFSCNIPPARDKTFRLIHISTFTRNKNVPLIIQAVQIARDQYNCQLELTLIGPLKNLPEVLHTQTPSWLKKFPEMDQMSLADQIRNHHALILYSDYETFGCVVAEALSCGRPVLISRIPTLTEICKDGVHGFIAASHNPEDLAKKNRNIMQQICRFFSLRFESVY